MGHKKLTDDCLGKLRNENILKFLLRQENLVLLRQLLDTETIKLEKLQKLNKRKSLDFGPLMFFEDMQELLMEVKEAVDGFLDVKGVPAPKLLPYSIFSWSTSCASLLVFLFGIASAFLGLFVWYIYHAYWAMFVLGTGFIYVGYRIVDKVVAYGAKVASSYSYNPLTQTIIVPFHMDSYGRRAELAYVLAHEYAHHVQKVFGIGRDFSRSFNLFKEGFAVGVQYRIAEIYSAKEGNDAFLFGPSDEIVGAMQGVYVWLARQLEAPFIKRAKWLKTSRRSFEPVLKTKFSPRRPTDHAIGGVVLSLWESKHGSRIYGGFLRGESEFEKSGDAAQKEKFEK